MIQKLQAMKSKKGFTLVELIVVIAIIAVLSAILVPTMMNWAHSAAITSVDSQAKTIKSTISEYMVDAMVEDGATFTPSEFGQVVGVTKVGSIFTYYTTPIETKALPDSTATGTTSHQADTKKFTTTDVSAKFAASLSDLPNCTFVLVIDKDGVLTSVFYSDDTKAVLKDTVTDGTKAPATLRALMASTKIESNNPAAGWVSDATFKYTAANADSALVGSAPKITVDTTATPTP